MESNKTESSLGVDGILVGHYTDEVAKTGCTVILCPNGAVAGVDVRGAAPGTRETDLLRGYNAVEKINAIMLSGGSAYGLSSACGAMKYLEEQGMGMDVGVAVVPIVPAAVIFDLAVGSAKERPGEEEGYLACVLAKPTFATGLVGAGTGATVGKALGQDNAMGGGLGVATMELGDGVVISAIAVVNALGDIYEPKTGKMIAGARLNGKLVPFSEAMGSIGSDVKFGNTTIGAVVTNASITREEANKLASMAHDGLALAIRPVHTKLDGDTFFAMSTCEVKGFDFMRLMCAAAEVVSRAIVNAVEHAEVL